MIVVNVVIDSSAQDIDAMKSAIATMEEHSRAEAGCGDYTFSVELNDPNRLRVTERWESMEALQAHMASAHMGAFQAAIAKNPPQGMQMHFYEATEVTPPSP